MIPEKMLKELDKSNQELLLDLFEIDATEFGGPIIYLSNISSEHGGPIFWRGVSYDPYPVQIEGAEFSNEGASNRPKLSVSNALGLVTGLVNAYDMMVGAKVTRRQVLATFLDASNFLNGNPQADPTQELVTTYIVSQMTSLTRSVGVFELNIPVEAENDLIPSRMIIANVCSWEYRGDGCGYDGIPVADEYDEPVSDIKKDKCSCSLKGCKLRWGKNAALPFGGFPSVDRIA